MLVHICCWQIIESGPTHADYVKINAFFDAMQNPKNCKGIQYIEVGMGGGGGFASQFQMSASVWMRAAAVSSFAAPVLVLGPLSRYSETKECAHTKHDWTCFFLPLSECQAEILKTGTKMKVDIGKIKAYDDNLIPAQFRHVGIAFWWGIIQERMFRLQPVVRKYIVESTLEMTCGSEIGRERGFPGVNYTTLEPHWQVTHDNPYADMPHHNLLGGMHVRHGDKHVDGFLPHSFEAQLKTLRASSQCLSVQGPVQMHQLNGTEADWAKQCYVRNSRTGSVEMMPIFVASDNANVLAKSSSMGLLVDVAGVSQTTQSTGMMATLADKLELRYNATLEIVRDVYLLSRCSHLVGIAASQIFRMAVGMSNATGTLVAATAVDQKEIPKVAHLSAVYGLPFVEHFAVPLVRK